MNRNKPKARPMLFSQPMVRAIRAGIKTQTRRIINPQPPQSTDKVISQPEDHGVSFLCMAEPVNGYRDVINARHSRKHPAMLPPHGQVGDLIWVRETHALVPSSAYRMSPGVKQIQNPSDPWECAVYREGWERSAPSRWRPSIHMPRWASRITLRLTSVRAERLQQIGREDALEEGIDRWDYTPSVSPYRNYRKGHKGEMNLHCSCPVRSFMTLWESINGAGSWAANPWVWVYGFETIMKNVDQVLERAS